MKTAIISYDLQNVSLLDNLRVKIELLKFSNTQDEIEGPNILQVLPDWVRLKLPDTTIIANVIDATTAESLKDEVSSIIASVGAKPGKIFIAFIDPIDYCLWNASAP